MGDVIPFPIWMAETAPRFRAFDDRVTGEVIILPCVRIEREKFEERVRRREKCEAEK